MKKYNKFWVTTNGLGDGVAIHTHKDFNLRMDDIFTNEKNILLVRYISIYGIEQTSLATYEEYDDISIEKIEEIDV